MTRQSRLHVAHAAWPSDRADLAGPGPVAPTTGPERDETSLSASTRRPVELPLAGRPGQGDPDEAGFVQIMQGRGTDPDQAKQLMAEEPRQPEFFDLKQPVILSPK